MIGQTISHYKILEKIGEGGMGVVYKAEDTSLKRIVALKFLASQSLGTPDEKTRFVHEAQAAAALDHPSICTVYEINEVEGQTFIAMAYIDGQSLRAKTERGPLNLEETLSLAIDIARGLQEAHEKGIVHRDIKSANVLVTKKGQGKITDFGLAKIAGSIRVTKTGTSVGTAAYMSPEQARGEDMDHRTDIWSFGVVLYEMLTGQLPFRGDYKQAVTYQIVHEEAEPVTAIRTGVPMELERIVNKCLEKDSSNRYQHVDDVLVDLRSLKDQIKTVSPKHKPPKPKASKLRLGYFLAVSVFLAAVVIVFLLLFLQSKNGAIQSIAVLPLENLSNDPGQEYFVDGMTVALITELSKISALRVISRTSIMQFKGMRKPLPEIARSLNVDAIVEGSVLRAGDKVRITAQLIKMRPEQNLLVEDYVRDLQDVITLQKEVAKAIVHKIKIKLTPAEEANLMITKPVNPKAYELYLLGRSFMYTAISESIQKGIEYFQKSLEIDTSYAPPYSGLADAYTTLGNYGLLQPYEAFPKAKEYAIKALEIDETLAEAHTILGYIKTAWDWDWAGAENSFKRAIELNPGYSYTYLLYSANFQALGRFDQAIETMNRAIELDPLSILNTTFLGSRLFSARRYDEAIAQLKKTLEMDPDYVEALWLLGRVHLQKKMYQEAIAEFQKSINLSKGVTMYIASLGHAYALSGNRSEALRILDELLELSRQQYVSSYEIAVVYTGLGEKDQAIARLKKAFEQRDGWLAFLLKVDPRLDSLRLDPRFISILKNMGLDK